MIEHKLYQEDLEYINNINIDWKKINNSSILITGGTGNIASVFVDALIWRNENYGSNIKIYVLSRNKDSAMECFGKYINKSYFTYISQDICEKIYIKGNIDYILHAASKGDPYSFGTDPVGIMQANERGTFQVLELARKKQCKKVIFISSGEVYGIYNGENEFLTEEDYGYLDILNSRNCYASSKRAGETLCSSYYRQYGVNVSIARPCHIYGTSRLEHDHKAFAQFMQQALCKEDIWLESSGEQKRTYCYVADCVTGLLYILLKGNNGQAYNISDKKSIISIKDLAEMIAEIGKVKVTYTKLGELKIENSSGIKKAMLDSQKLETLGWKASIDINQGVKKVYSKMIVLGGDIN